MFFPWLALSLCPRLVGRCLKYKADAAWAKKILFRLRLPPKQRPVHLWHLCLCIQGLKLCQHKRPHAAHDQVHTVIFEIKGMQPISRVIGLHLELLGKQVWEAFWNQERGTGENQWNQEHVSVEQSKSTVSESHWFQIHAIRLPPKPLDFQSSNLCKTNCEEVNKELQLPCLGTLFPSCVDQLSKVIVQCLGYGS